MEDRTRTLAIWRQKTADALKNGTPADAIEALETLSALEPEEAAHPFELGKILLRLNQVQPAIAQFTKVVRLKPEWPPGYEKLGCSLVDMQQHDAAQRVFSLGLERDPQNLALCFHMTLLLEGKNQLRQARQVIEAGLKRHPGDPALNFAAAKVDQRAGQRQAAMGRLERVLKDGSQPELVMAAHYELGQLYDRFRNTDTAFEHFQRANRLARQISDAQGLKPETYLQRLERMRLHLSNLEPRPPATVANIIDPRTTPIFLVGFPRSGTSLLGQMLDSHPAIRILEERPILESLEAHLETEEAPYPQKLTDLGEAELEPLRKLYFENAAQHVDRRPGEILLDKMPLNLRNLVLINRLFPGAPIILALRHPCDTVLSAFMQGFGANESMIHFHTLEGSARLYARIMELWRLASNRLPLRVHKIHYERVVADLEGEARRLIDFLGLPWNDSVLRYREGLTAGKTMTTPSYRQVAEPIYQRALFRWHHYRQHFLPHLRLLKPAMEEFGYDDGPAAPGDQTANMHHFPQKRH